MITVKKLYTLKTGTRLRKIVRLMEEWEKSLLDNAGGDGEYFSRLLTEMLKDPDLSESVIEQIQKIKQSNAADISTLRRGVNSLRHTLLNQLDISQADWDFIHPGDISEKGESVRFPGVSIYLDEIRSPFNVGSIFRTAESMGVSEVYLSPGTADPLHPRAKRTSMGCVEKISWRRMSYQELADLNRPVFALELGGTPVESFKYPESGILILGSEEVGVSPECLGLADGSLGRASISLFGWKGSLNVSVAFGIIVNRWVQKLSV